MGKNPRVIQVMSGRIGAALCLLLWPVPMLAQSIDGELKRLVTAIRARDGIAAQASLVGAAVALDRLQRMVKPVSEATDILSRATKVLSAEPIELDYLVEAIEKDARRIEGMRPLVPPFGIPIPSQKYPGLESADPRIRSIALGKLRTESNMMRDRYAKKFDEMVSARDQARRLLQQAEAATDNGIKVEKILDDLNASNAGPLFNLGGGRLVYTLLDMSLYVRPALQLRENACRELVARYEAVVQEMRGRLDRFRTLDQWASFYMWQDWVRVNASTKTHSVEAQMSEAEALAAKAGSLGKKAQSNGATTWLLNQTVLSTSATMEKAQALIDQANTADAKAATAREFNALLQLAASVNGVASTQASGSNKMPSRQPPPPPPKKPSVSPPPPPIIVYQTTTFEFKLVPDAQQPVRKP